MLDTEKCIDGLNGNSLTGTCTSVYALSGCCGVIFTRFFSTSKQIIWNTFVYQTLRDLPMGSSINEVFIKCESHLGNCKDMKVKFFILPR